MHSIIRMNIKIDVREAELLKKCETNLQVVTNFKDLKLVPEQLPLGDIIISDGTNDLLIIERKTLSDLAASIKDGRYEEQSYRLKNLWHHNHNIIYLIEGDFARFNSFKDRIDKQTLYSALVSINYYKGFSVWRSSSVEETALIVCNMAYKIKKEMEKGRTPFYSNTLIQNTTTSLETDTNLTTTGDAAIAADVSVATATEKDYCTVVKKVKKDNITIENIGEIMLCQIPGISSSSALAILAQFKTMPNLIKSIAADETCLNNVCTIDANGKSRKISKTAIATIIKFLRSE
jgi:ERCC4-type nuclease